MISLVDIAETFITSLVVALLFTPLCTVIAKATGYVDHPKDIKVHASATPLLGGVAIYAAFTVALFSSGLLAYDIRFKHCQAFPDLSKFQVFSSSIDDHELVVFFNHGGQVCKP